MFREKLTTIKSKVQDVIEEAGKSDIAKKAGQFTGSISNVSSSISEKAQELGKTTAFKSISQATEAVKREIDTTTLQGKSRSTSDTEQQKLVVLI